MITIAQPKAFEPESIQPLAVSRHEAAKMLGVCERTLWQWTKEGQVPHVKIGRRVIYPIVGLKKLINGELDR